MKTKRRIPEDIRVIPMSEDPPESFLRVLIDMMEAHREEIEQGMQQEREEQERSA